MFIEPTITQILWGSLGTYGLIQELCLKKDDDDDDDEFESLLVSLFAYNNTLDMESVILFSSDTRFTKHDVIT